LIPGLSALVRLRDEEAWCGLALESIAGWCDEIVIVTNTCIDRTPEIVAEFVAQHAHARVYDYPHRIWPMGPGHDAISADDSRSSAALYNFTASKATRTHGLKWDGDMIAMDWLGGEIRRLMSKGRDRIRFEGVDIVGDSLRHIGCHPQCRTNGVYRLAGTHYLQGAMTQSLRGVPDAEDAFGRPAFLHFKWARKSFASATAQWPEGWQEMPHFQNIAARRHPVAPYRGEYPASVRALL
jgi:hypothetical protein